jgi:hypothetical protein
MWFQLMPKGHGTTELSVENITAKSIPKNEVLATASHQKSKSIYIGKRVGRKWCCTEE